MDSYQLLINQLLEKIELTNGAIDTQNLLIQDKSKVISDYSKRRLIIESNISKLNGKLMALKESNKVISSKRKRLLFNYLIRMLPLLIFSVLIIGISKIAILKIVAGIIAGLSGLGFGIIEYVKYRKQTAYHRYAKENYNKEELDMEIDNLTQENLALSKNINKLIADEYLLKQVLDNLTEYQNKLSSSVELITQKRNKVINSICEANETTIEYNFDEDKDIKEILKLERTKPNGENV